MGGKALLVCDGYYLLVPGEIRAGPIRATVDSEGGEATQAECRVCGFAGGLKQSANRMSFARCDHVMWSG